MLLSRRRLDKTNYFPWSSCSFNFLTTFSSLRICLRCRSMTKRSSRLRRWSSKRAAMFLKKWTILWKILWGTCRGWKKGLNTSGSIVSTSLSLVDAHISCYPFSKPFGKRPIRGTSDIKEATSTTMLFPTSAFWWVRSWPITVRLTCPSPIWSSCCQWLKISRQIKNNILF